MGLTITKSRVDVYFSRLLVKALILTSCFISPLSFAGVELILQTSQSWDGGAIAYPKGDPEISAIRLTLKEGEEAKFHCHPVPTLGYIAQGTVEVTTITGKSTRLHQGETAVEVMNTWHKGKAVDGDVEIIAFYVGVKGLKNTFRMGDPTTAGDKCEVDMSSINPEK